MVLNNYKIAIIGAGSVGSTLAYTLMLGRIVTEIVIIDQNEQKAQGEAMDLNHGLSFVDSTNIYAGDYRATKDAKIIVITAGAAQKTGETRIDLLNRNIIILKKIIDNIVQYNKSAVLLVVTNPVDILSYATFRFSSFPSHRVIGSGTVLDTSRLKFLISKYCQINPKNVHAYVIGEHGDSEFPLWSHALIGGSPIQDFCKECSGCDNCIKKTNLDRFLEETKSAAYKIIEKKGTSCYATALAIRSIVHSILRNECSILCTSNLINGYYGVNNVYLGTPAVINRIGVRNLITLRLSTKEKKYFIRSADKLKQLIKRVNL